MATSSFSKTLDPAPLAPSLSLTIAKRMWAGSMVSAFICLASSMPFARKRLAAGVKGISFGTTPSPRPRSSSTAFRASFTVTPNFFITLPVAPAFSPITPTRSISVLTKLWPKRLASSCAIITALIAFSLKRSNIIVIEDRAEPPRVGAAGAAVMEPAREEPMKEETPEDTLPTPAPPKAPAPLDVACDTAAAAPPARPRRGTTCARLLARRPKRPKAAAAAAVTPIAAAEFPVAAVLASVSTSASRSCRSSDPLPAALAAILRPCFATAPRRVGAKAPGREVKQSSCGVVCAKRVKAASVAAAKARRRVRLDVRSRQRRWSCLEPAAGAKIWEGLAPKSALVIDGIAD
mmetsp:Transcript_71603/g.153046  ORF Transcript_71603/g.153046 Transcript_71603/m.153046 type:complete len:349 (-) Transcript_71603:63-1109(-)